MFAFVSDVENDLATLYNGSFSIDVEVAAEHVCIDQDGNNRTCTDAEIGPPAYDSGAGVCQNAVIKVPTFAQ